MVWKWIAAGTAGILVAAAGWFFLRSGEPPKVPVASVLREAIESVVNTNGKLEPVRWAAARAEAGGLISNVPVSRGQSVRRGQTLAVLEPREARAALTAAEARIAEAQSQIEMLERGGRSSELSDIEANEKTATLDRDQAARDVASLERLLQKQAATRVELDRARDRLAAANAQLSSLAARRKALVAPGEIASARARRKDAEAAAALARLQISQGRITAPLDGVVYELAVRAGDFVTAGDLVANVGQTSTLRATVFVDEPDLGRIREGLPVSITWDALPDRRWKGVVEKAPTQVAALGTRQVGEALCLVENGDGALLPGTNINAAIRTQDSPSALTVPREAVRRRDNDTGVFAVENGIVRWRPVTLGIASLSRIEVAKGLSEGETVALLSDAALSDGMAITPVVR